MTALCKDPLEAALDTVRAAVGANTHVDTVRLVILYEGDTNDVVSVEVDITSGFVKLNEPQESK